MTFIDAIGQAHAPDPAARIVSLVPSITELLCELGLAGQLVGRTGFCIHPAQVVAGIPKVGGTKDVNLKRLRELAPTHVIVNIDENEKPTVDKIAAFVPNVVVTHPLAPLDNLALARLVGGVFCRQREAEEWCAQFGREYEALQREPRAAGTWLYCIWQDPWMTVSPDTYIARMLELAGVKVPLLGEARYPRFAWDGELVRSIDGVLLSTEPYRFTQAHADALERQLGKPVYLVDGEMMSWYGSRSLAALRYLRSGDWPLR